MHNKEYVYYPGIIIMVVESYYTYFLSSMQLLTPLPSKERYGVFFLKAASGHNLGSSRALVLRNSHDQGVIAKNSPHISRWVSERCALRRGSPPRFFFSNLSPSATIFLSSSAESARLRAQ